MNKEKNFIVNGQGSSKFIHGEFREKIVYGYFLNTFKEKRILNFPQTGKNRVELDMVIELKLIHNLQTKEWTYSVSRENAEFYIDSIRKYKSIPKKYKDEFKVLMEFYKEVWGNE